MTNKNVTCLFSSHPVTRKGLIEFNRGQAWTTIIGSDILDWTRLSNKSRLDPKYSPIQVGGRNLGKEKSWAQA